MRDGWPAPFGVARMAQCWFRRLNICSKWILWIPFYCYSTFTPKPVSSSYNKLNTSFYTDSYSCVWFRLKSKWLNSFSFSFLFLHLRGVTNVILSTIYIAKSMQNWKHCINSALFRYLKSYEHVMKTSVMKLENVYLVHEKTFNIFV